MIYDEGTGRPIYVPLSGRAPLPEGVPEPTTATREAIVRVATDHPRWDPDRVYAQLRLTRHDIPLAVVEIVLADLQKTPKNGSRTR